MKPARLLAAPLLLLLCALQLAALLHAPAAWLPADVAVTLGRNDGVVLDHDALALAGADDAQLRLRRDGAGRWAVGAAPGGRPVTLLRGEHATRSSSVAPAAGQAFRLGGARFAVDDVDGVDGNAGAVRALTLARAGTRWRYDGATLLRDGAVQPGCPDAHLGVRVAALWNRILPRLLAVPRPLVFGGNLDCGNRIAIAGLDAPAARIAASPDGLLLSAGDAAMLLEDSEDSEDGKDNTRARLLAERDQDLAGATGLVVGRTRFGVRLDGERLHLTPMTHVALYAQPEQRRPPPHVARTWQRRDLWQVPATAAPVAAGAAAAMLAAAGLLLAMTRKRRRPRDWPCALGGAALLACGATLLILQRMGAPAGAGIAVATAWAAFGFALAAPRTLPPALAAGLLLLALGVLAQLELGLGAPDSGWLRQVCRTTSLLALAAGAGGLLRLARFDTAPAQARIEAALLLLALTALAGLLMEVVFGDETGVFDLQPVEFAKLALSALAAHCLALAAAGQGRAGGALRRWLRLGAPALLFIVLLAVALVQVDDYSPLVLLALWGGVLALAHACATRQRRLAAGLVACALAGVAGVAALRMLGAGEIATWNFYGDRFLVWLDPGAHPHTGQQLLLGARAIAAGGWRGADGAFGLLSLGQDAGPALRIPAVQDDFAASFFLERHGLAAALGLWGLQALFLALLARTALACWRAGGAARDYRAAWRARFRCFALLGCAAFALGHFLLSWGTNLAIFPVMGQPMSFLSAGGSHLLFFICPLLGLAAASSPTFEENESCRSTSNMKP